MSRDFDAFISYTRRQGEPLAEHVLKLLKGHSFKVWQDCTHMRGGEDFWRQIETAIENSNYLIMVLTPDAFDSDRHILRNEWLTARRRGCSVLPIFTRSSHVDFSSKTVPSWLKKLDCYDLGNATHCSRFIENLRTTPEFRPIPHNVEFPTHYVSREEEMAVTLHALTNSPEGARVAIRGAGGFGKTTLAKALCFKEDILAFYTDGVIWLTVGEEKRSPAALLTSLLQQLGQRPDSFDEEVLFGQWKEVLRTRQCLVVLDDIWRESDALALVVRETTTSFLITTCSATIILSGLTTIILSG